MSPENDKLLCEKYPKIFAQRHLPMNQTAMCWGVECDDGWFNLLDQLCGFIQFHLDHNNADGAIAQVEAVQVKEKFGTLRFYYTGGDRYINGAANFAEFISGTICEITGLPGTICINHGWYKTLSAAKAAELGFRDPHKPEGGS